MRLSKSTFIMVILVTLTAISCSSAPSKSSASLRIDFVSATAAMVKSDYTFIDAHVLAASSSNEKTIRSLAAYLSKSASTDEEKARAIFFWLTDNIAYDAESFKSGRYGDYSPRGVLKNRIAVCQGYAELFSALAGEMGLKSHVISGYAKGYGYNVGEDMNNNHAWNVVKIDGTWHLVDATWGAGSVDSNYKFNKKLKEFYFLPSPADMIFTHFPENNKWQLLDRPLTAAEFAPMVVLRPAAFSLGIRPLSHLMGYIVAEDKLAIKFSTSEELQFLTTFMRKNRKVDRKNISISTEGGVSTIMITFPKRGEYELLIFAANPSVSSVNSGNGTTISSFGWVGSYTIKAN